MSQMAVLHALKRGPMTGRQLSEALAYSSGEIARTCNKLLADGRVVRTDGQSGRGKRATYALAGAA